MKYRFFLAALLSPPCLALMGCGNTSTQKAEIPTAIPTAEEIAAAQADTDKASESERAYQSQNAVGKKAGSNR